MGFPQIEDNDDDVVELLRVIARNTGGTDGSEIDVDVGGSGYSGGGVAPRDWKVFETSDLDDANDDGSITLEPGDDVPIAKATSSEGLALLSVGASDRSDVRYYLRFGSRTIGGVTNTPLGGINSPFSAVEQLGGPLPAERTIEYRARLDDDATAPVDVVGLLHVEV